MKRFSVIIPVLDSPLIPLVCAALRRQTVSPGEMEVLVIGEDSAAQVVEDDLVSFIPCPGATAAHKRNLGMEQARGDIFLFTDSDCLPASDWLATHVSRHEQGEKVVGGAVSFGQENYFQLADNVSAFHDLLPYTAAGTRRYLATANLSVQRDVVNHAGPMIPTLERAHDLEWTARFRAAGYRLYFEPAAIVEHHPPRRDLAAVWRHWADDAPDTLQVRLYYRHLLRTPWLASCRPAFLWLSPLIAVWATARTFRHRLTRQYYGYTLPLVYLTKLIWCWSAFHHFPKASTRQFSWEKNLQ